MIDEFELKKIKDITEELLLNMTLEISGVEVESLPEMGAAHHRDYVKVNIMAKEPQMLIGQNGQTLFELSRLLMIILNKKLSRSQTDTGSRMSATEVGISGKKDLYLDLDINNYKQQKTEYLKKMARDLADEVSKTQKAKELPPMPSYERRIVHGELALRQDVVTTSQGEGALRHIIISPK